MLDHLPCILETSTCHFRTVNGNNNITTIYVSGAVQYGDNGVKKMWFSFGSTYTTSLK
jgi:hypothetical protein